MQETEEYGEILLSLNYLPTAGRLNVDIIKAKQLLQTNLVRGAGISILSLGVPLSSYLLSANSVCAFSLLFLLSTSIFCQISHTTLTISSCVVLPFLTFTAQPECKCETFLFNHSFSFLPPPSLWEATLSFHSFLPFLS